MGVDVDDPLPPENWAGTGSPALDLDGLYRRERLRLARFFTRRGGAEDVADLVQEAFRRLIGACRPQESVIESPEAYLNRIAGNLLRERARSAEGRAQADRRPYEDASVISLDPHRQLEARDTVARIEAALATLKPRTREIFLMHRLDGLSYAQIASIEGLSVKGVEKQMAKALFALRRRVDRR